MFANDALLRVVLDGVHKTMSMCRQKLKCRASLRNLTDLSPIVPSDTRWSVQYLMLRRYNEIRDEIAVVSKEQDAIIPIVTRYQ